jgi:hypothetical protein
MPKHLKKEKRKNRQQTETLKSKSLQKSNFSPAIGE